ncbi:MAG: Hsp70 family protein [Myxococcota bacterium]
MSDSPPIRLGIDLGTTRTVAVAVDRGRYPVASFDLGGCFSDHLPGLAVHAKGQWWFGERARALLAKPEPSQFAIASVKRLVSTMAPDDPIEGVSEPCTALALLQAYLTWVREMLLHHCNLELPKATDAPLPVMVAVPANASTRQRYLTLEAFNRAGFSVLGLVNEPTAAAIEYAYREPVALSPRSPKRYVVVYDLGGGTFDTAAVSLEGRRFDLLTSEGIAQLGGADFDATIWQMVSEGLIEAGTPREAVEAVPLAASHELCRDAKEGLRPSSRRLIIDPAALLPDAAPVVLRTDTLYERCRPLIQRTIDLVDELFAGVSKHGLDPEDSRQLGALYLVGGSVAFPPVARRLRERFGRKIKLSAQPHAATAMGLAVAADPAADIRVREATTRHFGVWREAEDGREKVFDPILTKDTMPTDASTLVVQRRYRPVHSVGHLRFLECTRLSGDGRPGGDLTPWQELRIPYDAELTGSEQSLDEAPIERHGHAGSEVVETYTRAGDGTITVQVDNPSAAYQQRWVLGALR